MIPAARVSAAIEVLELIEKNRRPATDALKEWGIAHRFAGSKDRAAIATIVFDAMRKKASSAWIMGENTPRAIVIGSLRQMRNMNADDIAAFFTGEGHAPAVLTADEIAKLASASLDDAPPHVRGDYPEWLHQAFASSYGEGAVDEGKALAERAPVDLRVNKIKLGREKAILELAHLSPEKTPLSPEGIRLPLTPDGRGPALSAEPAYVKGLVEVQDEGSQLASALANAQPGEQVLDLCAGGGGKTLALAARMQNKGQIYAADSDGRRLMPIFPRLERAGVRNVQVRAPKGSLDVLADLKNACDLVLVDAPCTGTGTWRRNPDAKWRMRPGALDQRINDQDEVLDRASKFVKKGGRILYITCSLLRQENEERVDKFMRDHSGFEVVPAAQMAEDAGLPDLAKYASSQGAGLRLSPHKSGTDGFYVAMLKRV